MLQAYIQIDTDLTGDIYVSEPDEIEIPPDDVLKNLKFFDGILESGTH